jgi:putative Mg2+ transporter-C (MgtC) family protein
LGAGAIIQDRGGVHGLTTAATIWLVASIGMACGARFHGLAIVAALTAILVLIGLGKLVKLVEHYGAKAKPESTPDDEDHTSL